jgi:DNA invertase Pin-like site-specific DNA recombinase
MVDEFYDVVSGADPIGDRPGFKAVLDRIAGNGVRTIIVESPDRFARDLIVQLTGTMARASRSSRRSKPISWERSFMARPFGGADGAQR